MTLPGDPAAGLPELDFSTIGPAVGTRFPDVELPDQTGRMVNLREHQAGRKGLVVFHRSAHW